MLEAGIDVYSTVNVQHLESLNDQVAQLTGARVRETIPDEVLSAADEVVLIDLTPEALIARLRAGKVYPPERVQAALNNFFKIENLAALRETALRQVAEDVEVKRLVARADADRAARRRGARRSRRGPAAGDRRAAAGAGRRSRRDSERVVRRAWRSAQRLDAELDVLVVRPPGRPPSRAGPRAPGGAAPPRRDARRAPARRGGRRRRRRSRSRVARELGSTYVLIGTPRRARAALGRAAAASARCSMRLLRELPGVDVRIVADPTLRGARARRTLPSGGLAGADDEGVEGAA